MKKPVLLSCCALAFGLSTQAYAGCANGTKHLWRSVSSNSTDYGRYFTMRRGGYSTISVDAEDGERLGFYIVSPSGERFCDKGYRPYVSCSFPVGYNGRYKVRVQNPNSYRVGYLFSCEDN